MGEKRQAWTRGQQTQGATPVNDRTGVRTKKRRSSPEWGKKGESVRDELHRHDETRSFILRKLMQHRKGLVHLARHRLGGVEQVKQLGVVHLQ